MEEKTIDQHWQEAIEKFGMNYEETDEVFFGRDALLIKTL